MCSKLRVTYEEWTTGPWLRWTRFLEYMTKNVFILHVWNSVRVQKTALRALF